MYLSLFSLSSLLCEVASEAVGAALFAFPCVCNRATRVNSGIFRELGALWS